MKNEFYILPAIFLQSLFNPKACTQGNEKASKEIYSTVICDYYKDKQSGILLIDSSVNDYIVKTNYREIGDAYSGDIPPIFIDTKRMDSTWTETLKEAEKAKYNLTVIKIPEFNSNCVHVDFASKVAAGKRETRDKVKFSSIIIIKNRAIVEFARSGGLLDASGTILFLEKIKGKWEVVSKIPVWES